MRPTEGLLARVLELPPGIVFTADRNLTLTSVNRVVPEMLGSEGDELIEIADAALYRVKGSRPTR